MSTSSNQLKNQPLLWRASFGPKAETLSGLTGISQSDLYADLIKTSSKKPMPFNVATNLFDGMVKGTQDVDMLKKLNQDQKKMLRKQSVDEVKKLNITR